MKLIMIGILLTLLEGQVACLANDTASITEVSGNGAVVVLDDGTKWLVNAGDRCKSSTWAVGDDVVVTDNDEIINTDESGEKVDARRLK